MNGNSMDENELLACYDREQRIDLAERAMRREASPEVVRLVCQGEGEGMVVYSKLDRGNADRVISEQISRFGAIGQDFEWKTYGHDAPPDLKSRLEAHGFIPEDPESLLVLEVDRAPEILLRPVSHDIRRIVDPARVELIGPIQEQVWGEADPVYLAALKEDLEQDPEHVSLYLAFADGFPVAHARITFHDRSRFAGLWGGSTLMEYRCRGFYTALLAVRVQEARRRGVEFLTIDASPMSRPIVEKHGFRFLTETQPFKWRAPSRRNARA
ncbi:MAG TPA: hypothetical protein PKM35_07280 [Holophaga sp.]|nr:hypothetical protein [Holophaga sp.]HPS66552.1 hypothetical protein [Holophaga sp.]